MKNTLILAFLFCAIISNAQDHPTCDGSRYVNDVFMEYDSTLSVKFGEGLTIGGNNQEMFFDLFEPAGDTAEKRPVIVFAYGGSYIAGTRTDMHWICKRFARKGFVTVTIDYRLYDAGIFPPPTEEEMKVVVTKSMTDMKGAIRYLRADADGDDLFRIDPDLIFAGGISAGAITACHAAFLDDHDTYAQDLLDIFAAEGGLEGNINDLDYSSEVQGVLNFSGGLHDGKWIDDSDPPLLSVHESGDGTVPYNGGYASIFNIDIIYMEGSGRLEEIADSVGIDNVLRTIDADTHVAYFANNMPEMTDNLINWSTTFLHDLVCEEQLLSADDLNKNLNTISIYPNPSKGILNFAHDMEGDFKIKIFDANGRVLIQSMLTKQLNVGHLERGFYFVEIQSKQKASSVTKKIILE